MAALISGHPVQKSIAIHFHPCNPVLVPQNTCSIMFCGILLSNLFVYLVAFDNIMWKLENSNFYDQSCPFKPYKVVELFVSMILSVMLKNGLLMILTVLKNGM